MHFGSLIVYTCYMSLLPWYIFLFSITSNAAWILCNLRLRIYNMIVRISLFLFARWLLGDFPVTLTFPAANLVPRVSHLPTRKAPFGVRRWKTLGTRLPSCWRDTSAVPNLIPIRFDRSKPEARLWFRRPAKVKLNSDTSGATKHWITGVVFALNMAPYSKVKCKLANKIPARLAKTMGGTTTEKFFFFGRRRIRLLRIFILIALFISWEKAPAV